MSDLKTMLLAPSGRLFQRHALPLPSCCPVSGNPQPGSEARISYRPAGRVLEVYALAAYLRSYVGGRADVRVRVRALVILQEGRLEILAVAP